MERGIAVGLGGYQTKSGGCPIQDYDIIILTSYGNALLANKVYMPECRTRSGAMKVPMCHHTTNNYSGFGPKRGLGLWVTQLSISAPIRIIVFRDRRF